MMTIVFDKNSPAWTKNPENNKLFLYYQQNYINDLLKARGYIFKNQIYELLGITWDPNDENTCYQYNGDRMFIGFKFESMDDDQIVIEVI